MPAFGRLFRCLPGADAVRCLDHDLDRVLDPFAGVAECLGKQGEGRRPDPSDPSDPSDPELPGDPSIDPPVMATPTFTG